ncbi:hypothetical protein CO038_03285 [Candidatus Pacearchaeota archaeon CG_4_9_14_0_2_um_filter_39_13]|nr:MAG: hypothetical protein CO038_03285 [Candidatus Pacearchaeota archaeon CG_4_9_14_0_2_um_filter_39_13]
MFLDEKLKYVRTHYSHMANITLSVPDDVYRKMKKHREMRWSEVARAAIISQVEKLEMMDQIAGKSKLNMKDIEEINEKIKKGLHSKLKE